MYRIYEFNIHMCVWVYVCGCGCGGGAGGGGGVGVGWGGWVDGWMGVGVIRYLKKKAERLLLIDDC